jgi:arylsulfatase A-like enzyme
MTIPWLVAGPGIKRDYEIQSQVTLLDTAPTLARVLGFEPHPEWQGHCIEEIFEPQKHPPINPLKVLIVTCTKGAT